MIPPEIQRVINEAGFWIGCEHPERPADEFMVTMAGCSGLRDCAPSRRPTLQTDRRRFHQRPEPIARGSLFGPDIEVLWPRLYV